MNNTLITIGPACEKLNDLFYIAKKTNFIRLNASHNSILWHKSIAKKIKKISKNINVLIDIPGIKPRTLNENNILIKKNQRICFSFKKKGKNIISLSNEIPKTLNKALTFSVDDGLYNFKFVSLKKNVLEGISLQTFILKPKKGLNIPNSKYNDKLQEKIYLNFLKKIKNISFDCIGLSFIQNEKVIKKIKKKYPNKIIISKIENTVGYLNRKRIIDESDFIMIDRGDLSAEVGFHNLTDYTDQIVNDCKLKGRGVILATENFITLMKSSQPSKSEILNLDYYKQKVDFIMLSEETATSNNWKSTLNWISSYLKNSKYKKQTNKFIFDVSNIIGNYKTNQIVVFSKKGYIIDNIKKIGDDKEIFFFTENVRIFRIASLLKNFIAIKTKRFPKTMDRFIYKYIKKYKKVVFKKNKFILLCYLSYPSKSLRANTLALLSKKSF